jgi:hypothetical protein
VSGKSHHWRVTGAGSIYHVDRTGFRIYLDNAQSSAFALENDWRVNYIAHSAPVPCLMSEWQDWSTCSRSCAGGRRVRSRVVLRQPYFGGTCAAPREEGAACADALQEPCAPRGVKITAQVAVPPFAVSVFQGDVEAQLRDWPPAAGAASPWTLKYEFVNVLDAGGAAGGGASTSPRASSYATDDEAPDTRLAVLRFSVSPDLADHVCALLSSLAADAGVVGAAIGGLECPLAPGAAPNATAQPHPHSHCTVGEWGEWGECSKTCGAEGTQTRQRPVLQRWEGLGDHCPPVAASQACGDGPCPVHCDVSPWGEWGPCCNSCGGGTQLRYRTVVESPAHGGFVCPNLVGDMACNTQPCPVDCTVSGFGDWSACSATCSWGAKRKSQTITRVARHGGQPCPPTVTLKPCHAGFCPVDCQVSGWGSWGVCSKSCDGGSNSRSRTVTSKGNHGGAICPELMESHECNNHACYLDCVVGAWSEGDVCTEPCGTGTLTRTRVVVTPAAGGGAACGSLSDTAECNTHACAIDCVASAWTGWSQCAGVELAARRLEAAHADEDPHTKWGGGISPDAEPDADHQADHQEETASTLEQYAALVHSYFVSNDPVEKAHIESQLQAYGVTLPTADPTDTTGAQASTAAPLQAFDPNAATAFDPNAATAFDPNAATAFDPNAATAFDPNAATAFDPNAATAFDPNAATAFDPNAASASDPNGATAGCGPGKRWRMRVVEVHSAHGGAPCGEHFQQESCDQGPCAVDCAVSEWSAYTACTVSCDGGTMTRTRSVVLDSSHSGSTCPTLAEAKECNTMRCAVDCVVSEYGPCGACSADCRKTADAPEPTHTKLRTVLRAAAWGGAVCPTLTLTHSCNTQICGVNCEVSEWSNWGPPVGEVWADMLVRTRTVKTAAAHGGGACPELSESKRWYCHAGETSLKFVTLYGDWSQCSKACSTGTRTREKRITYCSKTAALNMHVAFRQSEKCNTDSCAPGEDEGAVQIVVPRHLHPTDPEPAVQYGAL